MNPKQELALEILAKVCKKDKSAIKPEQDLAADLGLDSPKGLQLLVELEEKLKIEISDEDAARMVTVDDVLSYVVSR